MLTKREYYSAVIIALLFCLASVSPSFAGGTITTTVTSVTINDGVPVLQTPQGDFELDYEVGIEALDRATSYLRSISGTNQTITFSYIDDAWNGQHIRVVTKTSTAAFASMR